MLSSLLVSKCEFWSDGVPTNILYICYVKINLTLSVLWDKKAKIGEKFLSDFEYTKKYKKAYPTKYESIRLHQDRGVYFRFAPWD